ncbi:MAG: HEAT repeat domain-containing protein [Planctomycetota bacterium]
MRWSWGLVFLCLSTARADDVDELIAGLARGTSEERRALIAELARRGSAILPRVQGVMLQDEDPLRRAAAADVIGAMGKRGHAALASLRRATRDPSVETRIAVLQALASLGPLARAATPDLMDWPDRMGWPDREFDRSEGYAVLALLAIHRDEPHWIRAHMSNEAFFSRAVRVAQTLEAHGEPIFDAFFRHARVHERRRVFKEVRFVADPPRHWLRLIERGSEDDPDPQVRRHARAALTFYADASSRPFARRALASSIEEQRVAGCAILARWPSERGDPERVIPLLRDPSAAVQLHALGALRAWRVQRDGLADRVRELRWAGADAVRQQAGLLLLELGHRDRWAMREAIDAALAQIYLPWDLSQRVPGDGRADRLFGAGSRPIAVAWAPEVVGAHGAHAIPFVAARFDEYPAATVMLLDRCGDGSVPRLRAAMQAEDRAARVAAMIALIERDEGRPEWGGKLIMDLMRIDVAHRNRSSTVKHAFRRLGPDAIPGIVRALLQVSRDRRNHELRQFSQLDWLSARLAWDLRKRLNANDLAVVPEDGAR